MLATLKQGRKPLAFWAGCFAVMIGVLLHIPMFLMGKDMGYRLAGMPMDTGMLVGMGLIVAGIGVAAYGLLPPAHILQKAAGVRMSPADDMRLTKAHWGLMVLLVVALIVDVMKPASLGLVTPGMRAEYGVSKAFVAWLPFTALTGTFVGSLVWGVLADVYGRRSSILLSSVIFVGTAICGAMPSFWWNVFMCFLMGAGAGGLLPVVYALLAEIMPARQRGWALVVVGGLGAAGGYLAATGLSALLQPTFGWRIMWLLNLPTGMLLILLSPLLPESAKFLMQTGRMDEARRILQAFGSRLEPVDARAEGAAPDLKAGRKGAALTLTGLTWSFINFGILLWLPAELVAKGYNIGLASKLLAYSAVIAFPAVALVAFLYSRWSTKGSLAVSMAVSALGLIGLVLVDRPIGTAPIDPLIPISLLILGSNGMLAVLLPYAAELFPARVRGRATGVVAGSTKFGGLIAQGLSLMALVPLLGHAAWAVIALLALCIGLILVYGEETRGRDLRTLDDIHA